MCGIFGLIASDDVVSQLVSGLKSLEYRGYDSSGVALMSESNDLKIVKAAGKITNLEAKLKEEQVSSNSGIAHTRWATHGKPVEKNAHPHANQNFAVVHNGIIENFREIKAELQQLGYEFYSETDTEIIPHLIDKYYQESGEILSAIRKTIADLNGAFALGIISKYAPDKIFAAKRGSPLALGLAKDANYIASDAYAIASYSDRICYLEDDDIAELSKEAINIFDKQHKQVSREIKFTNFSSANVGKGNYRHYMLKEINEQPAVIADIMNTYCDRETNKIIFPNANLDFTELKKVTFVACGSSHFAALIAKNWFENIANIDCKIEVASEFLYSNHFVHSGLVVFISQSGETADSLKALKMVKAEGVKTLVITNVEHSSMANLADYVINLLAGPEIGVASTKAFTAQLVILALLALESAATKNLIAADKKLSLCRALRKLPGLMTESLNLEGQIIEIANQLKNIHNIIYIGRGTSYGLAKEAALKLKEISYIHAEGIAAGELKHGPIALIDEDLYIVALLPADDIAEKTISNLQEVHARSGKIITITDKKLTDEVSELSNQVIAVAEVESFAAPILYTIPAQLLAYHVAVLKGTDVDQPRNLAKSVTVE